MQENINVDKEQAINHFMELHPEYTREEATSIIEVNLELSERLCWYLGRIERVLLILNIMKHTLNICIILILASFLFPNNIASLYYLLGGSFLSLTTLIVGKVYLWFYERRTHRNIYYQDIKELEERTEKNKTQGSN